MARPVIRRMVRGVLAVAALGWTGVARAEAIQWGSPPQADPGLEASDPERDRPVAPSRAALDSSDLAEPPAISSIEERYETETDRLRRFDDGDPARKQDGPSAVQSQRR